MDLERIREGTTSFFAPRQDPNHAFPPASSAVFFNRRMELNRDATVLLVSILKPERYLDAMGATGVRGIRIANECGVPVTINDRNSDAVDLIEQNAEGYEELVQVTQADINVLLSGRRFDAVDIDPFGTPAYFVDAAARSASRFLFITATDTAPLCGAHLKAGIRRYFAHPMNTEYHSEVGLRILLGFAAREVVKYDRGVEPLFCFAREHFVRLHLRLTNGAEAADRTIARIGFVHQCPRCPYRVEEQGIVARTRTCPECAAELKPIGPLWLGAVSDRPLLASMQELLKELELGKKTQIQRLIETCENELDTASFYDYHRLTKLWRVSPPNIATLLGNLEERGYAASRTHHTGTGFKTDAPVGVIQEVLTLTHG
jgi:tRNA (guanine26-N2/guanine27-N2)-dimethyltransferase